MPASTGPRQRLSRRAKLQGVDYAVLSSGQQIPEYSSEDDSSEDDESYGASSSKRKKRKRFTRSDGITGASSNSSSSSSNAAGTSNGAAKRKRKANVPSDCFICQKESKSAFMQCEICSRWCVCSSTC